MPELPEVENVVRELRRKIKNKVIADVAVRFSGVVFPVKSFAKELKGKKIAGVSRRGKLIIIELSGNKFLLVHLKMTGQLVFNQKEATKHTHVVIKFKDKTELHYNDIRKFGFLSIVDGTGLKKVLEERFNFGPEPLEATFNLKDFGAKLKKRSAAIKTLLLNQTILAGVGNIYADESLFRAKIRPTRRASSLKPGEVKLLHLKIKEVLKQAIDAGGSSAKNYVKTSGKKGSFQKLFQVYSRTGKPCYVCGTLVERLVLGSRSTHFCKVCQK